MRAKTVERGAISSVRDTGPTAAFTRHATVSHRQSSGVPSMVLAGCTQPSPGKLPKPDHRSAEAHISAPKQGRFCPAVAGQARTAVGCGAVRYRATHRPIIMLLKAFKRRMRHVRLQHANASRRTSQRFRIGHAPPLSAKGLHSNRHPLKRNSITLWRLRPWRAPRRPITPDTMSNVNTLGQCGGNLSPASTADLEHNDDAHDA